MALIGIPQPVRKLEAEAKGKEAAFVVGLDAAAVGALLDKLPDYFGAEAAGDQPMRSSAPRRSTSARPARRQRARAERSQHHAPGADFGRAVQRPLRAARLCLRQRQPRDAACARRARRALRGRSEGHRAPARRRARRASRRPKQRSIAGIRRPPRGCSRAYLSGAAVRAAADRQRATLAAAAAHDRPW